MKIDSVNINRSAIVFGHSSGLGFELTNKLLEKGYQVIGFSNTETTTRSDRLVSVIADLSSRPELEKVKDLILEIHNKFDLLIYSAGILNGCPIDDFSYESLEKLYKANTFAPMYIESRLLNHIKENGSYVINVTSSTVEHYSYSSFAEYSSSKAALAKFTKDIRKELAGTSARVMDFCPAGFKSNIYKNMNGNKVERDESEQMSPADLAGIIIYLAELPKNIEIPYIFANRK